MFAIILGMTAYRHHATLAATPSEQDPPLRLSEPVEAIVADLESYIPEYMRAEDIPGVAIALIHDGEIVWTEGFGVVNTITAKQITPETVFEVASNSKVVTAYIALRLVDQGKLSLGEPLNAYLPEPWLPSSVYRDAITLRHALSHSSGLGKIGRESLFAPGHGYYYSSSGFHYLPAVIEHVIGQSIEDVAQEMVCAPLGMLSSSFVNHAEITPRTANGHVHAIEYYDPDHSESEDRFLMLGLSYQVRVLVVSYTLRKDGTEIRIISARKATKKEQKTYSGEKL